MSLKDSNNNDGKLVSYPTTVPGPPIALGANNTLLFDPTASVIGSGGGSTPGSVLQAGGLAVVTTTGGTSTLTAQQTQAGVLAIRGALTSNAIVQMPNTPGLKYMVLNQTTGNFTVTVQPVGGSGFVVPQGTNVNVGLDDSGVLQSA